MSRSSAIRRERAEQRRAAARQRRRRLLLWGGIAVGFVGLLAAATVASLPWTPKASQVRSAGIAFQYLDGRPGSLADFAGKPLVVNFFASWCPTCWEEMDDIERVYRRRRGDVGFLGLALQESAEGARSIVERTGVTYTLGSDPTGAIFRQLGGRGMPTTIFFDARGRVVRNVTGGLDEEAITNLIRALFVERRQDVAVEAGCQFKEYPVQGREHVSPEGAPGAEQYRAPYAWSSNPPTSGWHDPTPVAWGVYTEPVHPAKLVHNLEHGGMVVQYQGLPRSDIGVLTRLVQEDPRKVVVAPGPTLQVKLSVGSWGRLMTCQSFDPAAVRRFIQSYRDKGPENVE